MVIERIRSLNSAKIEVITFVTVWKILSYPDSADCSCTVAYRQYPQLLKGTMHYIHINYEELSPLNHEHVLTTHKVCDGFTFARPKSRGGEQWG